MAQLLECGECCALMTAERMRKHELWHIEAERILTAMTRSEARLRSGAVEPAVAADPDTLAAD